MRTRTTEFLFIGANVILFTAFGWSQQASTGQPPAVPPQGERIDNAHRLKSDQIFKWIDRDTATINGRERILNLFKVFEDATFQDYFGYCPDKDNTDAQRVTHADNLKRHFPFGNAPNCNESNVYAVLHVLKWAPPTTDTAGHRKQSVLEQNWYLFRFSAKGIWEVDDISQLAHLSGTASVFFLYVHMGLDTSVQAVDLTGNSNLGPFYLINAVKKVPSNLAHLYAAAQVAGVNVTPTKVTPQAAPPPPPPPGPPAPAPPEFFPPAGEYTSPITASIRAAPGTAIYYTTDGSTPTVKSTAYSSPIPISSTTTIKAIAVADSTVSTVSSVEYVFPVIDYWGGGHVVLTYKTSTINITSSLDNGTTSPMLISSATYDNEGPQYWDIGFAVPLKSISQVQLNSVAGTLAPVSVNKQNLFFVVDGYYPGLDLSKNTFAHWPHPLAGVAIASQPFHKILVAGAWGPSFSEVYVGALWVKQPRIPAAGSSISYHYSAQVSVGLNLQVSSILSHVSH